MHRAALFVILASWLILLCGGCGGSSGEKPTADAKKSEGEPEAPKNELKHYDITDLPPVDEPLQRMLDGERLQLCPPADWGFFSQANYLVVFAKTKVSELPRMTVAAAESPFGSDDTTAENAQSLAKSIQKKLTKDKKVVRENPKAIKLGDSVWVRHVRQVTQSGTPCAVQSLQTVRDGRLYTLEMFSAAKEDSSASLATAIKEVRDQAYAVAANSKFTKGSVKPAIPPTEEKPPEKAPEAKPAETPPAETKPAETKPAPATEKPAEAK